MCLAVTGLFRPQLIEMERMSVLFIAFRFSYYFNCSSHLDDQRHPPIRRKSSECVYNLRARKWSLLSTSVSEVFQFELKNCGFHFWLSFLDRTTTLMLLNILACLSVAQPAPGGVYALGNVRCKPSTGCRLQSAVYTLPPNTFDSTPISHSFGGKRFLSVHARLPFSCIYVRARGDG